MSEFVKQVDNGSGESVPAVVNEHPLIDSTGPVVQRPSIVVPDLFQGSPQRAKILRTIDLENAALRIEVAVALQIADPTVRPDAVKIAWICPLHYL